MLGIFSGSFGSINLFNYNLRGGRVIYSSGTTDEQEKDGADLAQ